MLRSYLIGSSGSWIDPRLGYRYFNGLQTREAGGTVCLLFRNTVLFFKFAGTGAGCTANCPPFHLVWHLYFDVMACIPNPIRLVVFAPQASPFSWPLVHKAERHRKECSTHTNAWRVNSAVYIHTTRTLCRCHDPPPPPPPSPSQIYVREKMMAWAATLQSNSPVPRLLWRRQGVQVFYVVRVGM